MTWDEAKTMPCTFMTLSPVRSGTLVHASDDTTYTELERAADWSLYKYSCTALITAWRGADSALKHAV